MARISTLALGFALTLVAGCSYLPSATSSDDAAAEAVDLRTALRSGRGGCYLANGTDGTGAHIQLFKTEFSRRGRGDVLMISSNAVATGEARHSAEDDTVCIEWDPADGEDAMEPVCLAANFDNGRLQLSGDSLRVNGPVTPGDCQ